MLGLLLRVAVVWLVLTAALWGVLLVVIVAERIGLLHGSVAGPTELDQLRVRVESAVADD